MATVKPAGANFSPEKTARLLQKAMKGLGTDEKAIIDILAGHCNRERQELKTMYKTCFGRDLVEDLKSETSGKFRSLIEYLLMPSRELDACSLKKAMKGVGTDERTLIEILCSKTNSQLAEIKETYKQLYKTTLEDDLQGDLSGDFKLLMISICQGHRDENPKVDNNQVQTDVQELYDAGPGKFGTDEAVFNRILVRRSIAHLQEVFKAYKQKHGKEMEEVVDVETSGNLKKAFLAIIHYIKNPRDYFAELLNKTMKGAGTDDERLMQLIVSHSEIDLKDIAKEYLKKYGWELTKDIADDTSGDYEKLLIRLAT
ncbi:hypothetical protein CHS0354_012915 [Potamilus streckersoni]|uniref:Annexin n=1 Tax=Potamilus streckersoni TaxID=2493646 RepID=A0AAE0RP05_9BIVA|nr:hypothetical protein CHS0354_012915 [Potamilus streckersoni]